MDKIKDKIHIKEKLGKKKGNNINNSQSKRTGKNVDRITKKRAKKVFAFFFFIYFSPLFLHLIKLANFFSVLYHRAFKTNRKKKNNKRKVKSFAIFYCLNSKVHLIRLIII